MDQCSIIFDDFEQSNVGSPAVNGLPPNNSPSTTTKKSAKKYNQNSTTTNKAAKKRETILQMNFIK